MTDTPAHDAKQGHHYTVHFPAHSARPDDPHYVDFNHFHKLNRASALCYVGQRIGFDWCRDAQSNLVPPAVIIPVTTGIVIQQGLELHHAHIEYALQNGIDLAALEIDYPGVSDRNDIGAWVESGINFRWLCVWHHRASAGAHTASHSDYEGGMYVPGLIVS